MIREETIITKTCDVCGKEVNAFAALYKGGDTEILHIQREGYYLASKFEKHLDICQSCNGTILRFLETLKEKENKND